MDAQASIRPGTSTYRLFYNTSRVHAVTRLECMLCQCCDT